VKGIAIISKKGLDNGFLWVVEIVVVVQVLHLQAPEVSWLSWSSETGAKVSGIVVLASESQNIGRGVHSKKMECL